MIYTCPHCPKTSPNARGLAVHLSIAHGVRSEHPKTEANRRSRPEQRAHISQQRSALPVRPAGPLDLLVAVVQVARLDANAGVTAAAEWLADVRRAVRP